MSIIHASIYAAQIICIIDLCKLKLFMGETESRDKEYVYTKYQSVLIKSKHA